MGNSILSKYNCDNNDGSSYYCSNCLKALENGEVGTTPKPSTNKDETQETVECTSSPNKRKSHLNCLLELFER